MAFQHSKIDETLRDFADFRSAENRFDIVEVTDSSSVPPICGAARKWSRKNRIEEREVRTVVPFGLALY